MRHLSAVPMLSTAMITVLMLSMSILIACAVTGSGPRPPEPISQPETPKDETSKDTAAPGAPEIQADFPGNLTRRRTSPEKRQAPPGWKNPRRRPAPGQSLWNWQTSQPRLHGANGARR